MGNIIFTFRGGINGNRNDGSNILCRISFNCCFGVKIDKT